MRPGWGSMARISQLISKLLLVVLGLILWRVFFPALMSYDSVIQFNQAWVGRYNDWHPPLLAVALHLFLKAGRNIGALMLVQCLAGLFGLRALVLACLRAFFGSAVPPRRAEGIALLVVLVLFLPVSPLPFYLVTFWKDSAAAVLMVWTCAVALPAVGLVLGSAVARRSRRLAAAMALAPLLAFAVCDNALDLAFHVRKVHLERQMMA